MADIKCLDAIPFAPDPVVLLRDLHLEPGTAEADEFAALLDRVQPQVRPRALFAEAFIDEHGEDSVTIDGVTYRSSVLARNLADLYRVFPYIATCGPEADEAVEPGGDFLTQFWIDTIKTKALAAARTFLVDHLMRSYATGNLSSMNPGSGDAELWPIQEQKLLFGYMGDTEAMAGVSLTSSCLMIPNKSVSGIFFPSEITFTTCCLCHRERCAGRRAAYDPSASSLVKQS